MRHDAFGLMEWMAFNLADSGFVIMRSARKPTIAFDKTVNENPFLVVKEDEEDDRLMQTIFPEKSAVTVEPVTKEEALRRMDEEGM